MLQYKFMQNSLLAAFMISIMIPLIGVVMVNRKTSLIGDALGHVSLTGVALGLIFSINPMIGAIITCIIGAFSIEFIRSKFPQYGDMAVAIVVSLGLGLASIFSDFTPGGNTLESYLFGSISAVSKKDLIMIAIAFVFVIIFSLKYYGALLDIAISSTMAKITGVSVNQVNNLFTFLAAISIALAAKVIGALMITSLIVLPVATALLISKSYRSTFLFSILFGILYMITGVIFSYYFDIKPGGAVVILAVLGVITIFIYQKIKKSVYQ